MTDYVTQFILRHAVQLPNRMAYQFRPLQQPERPGTFSHSTLPYGSSREGITNGVVAYVLFTVAGCECVKHVSLANLEFDTDKQENEVLDETDPAKPSIFDPRQFTTQHEFWLEEHQSLKRATQKPAKRSTSSSGPRKTREQKLLAIYGHVL